MTTSLSTYSLLDFEIDQPRLLAALSSANGIAEKRNASQPILADVLIRASKDGVLVHSTDMHRSLSEDLAATVAKPGVVSVSASYLRNIVATLPAKPIRVRGMDNFWVQLSVGRSEFKIMGHQPSDFPDLPDSKAARFTPIPAALLSELIDKTSFSVSTDEARVNLNGALFEMTGKAATMVSTDGHRLTKLTVAMEAPAQPKGVIIPRRGLLDMRKMLDRSGGTVEMALDGQHIFLRAPGITLAIKLNNVVFPPYEQVIPREHKRLVTVDRHELIATLHRALVMAPEKTATVRLSAQPMSSGKGPAILAFTADNPDLGVCHEEIEVEMTGEPIIAGFNARYLLDVIEAMATKQVALRFQGELDPCVVVPVDGPDYLGVVMPMRI